MAENKKIFVIGSVKYAESIRKVAEYLEHEYECQVDYVKRRDDESFDVLVEEAFNKIDASDVIFAVAKDNYPTGFGHGTIYELEYAKRMGKVVYMVYLTVPDDGKERLIITDRKDYPRKFISYDKYCELYLAKSSEDIQNGC